MRIITPPPSMPPQGQSFLREPWDAPGNMRHGPQGRPDPRGGATAPGVPGAVPVTASHWYARVISLSFSVSLVSQRLLDEPISPRNFLAMRNASASANIFVGFGTDASLTASWLRITPNTMILFDTVVPQDDLYFIADAASAVIALGYSTTTR